MHAQAYQLKEKCTNESDEKQFAKHFMFTTTLRTVENDTFTKRTDYCKAERHLIRHIAIRYTLNIIQLY